MEKKDISTQDDAYLISPPIDYLERLHKLNPSYLERFLTSSEKEQENVHLMRLEGIALQKQNIRNNYKLNVLGQSFGLVSLATTLGFIAFLATIGRLDFAIASILTAVATIIGLFIYKHKRNL
jgi:uncharacterized membrane protein